MLMKTPKDTGKLQQSQHAVLVPLHDGVLRKVMFIAKGYIVLASEHKWSTMVKMIRKNSRGPQCVMRCIEEYMYTNTINMAV